MRNLSIILVCFIPVFGIGQTSGANNLNTVQPEQNETGNWIAGLYEMGMTVTEDSIVISKEFQKVLEDEAYRDILYPESYSWQQALDFMQANELKKAFWFFINLYVENEQNKELVVKSILAYDQLLKMDEVLIATFYTYSFMDPEVSIIKNGQPEITRPDILEAKLRTVKEIVGYIYAYRNQKNKQ